MLGQSGRGPQFIQNSCSLSSVQTFAPVADEKCRFVLRREQRTDLQPQPHASYAGIAERRQPFLAALADNAYRARLGTHILDIEGQSFGNTKT